MEHFSVPGKIGMCMVIMAAGWLVTWMALNNLTTWDKFFTKVKSIFKA